MDLNSAVGIQIGFSIRKMAAEKKKKALETSCCLARREHLKEEVHHLYTALGEWRRTERERREGKSVPNYHLWGEAFPRPRRKRNERNAFSIACFLPS